MDDDATALAREYRRFPDCGLPESSLDAMVEAVIEERLRCHVIQQHEPKVAWCGCQGPPSFCHCKRLALKQDLAAAVAALAAQPRS